MLSNTILWFFTITSVLLTAWNGALFLVTGDLVHLFGVALGLCAVLQFNSLIHDR